MNWLFIIRLIAIIAPFIASAIGFIIWGLSGFIAGAVIGALAGGILEGLVRGYLDEDDENDWAED